MNNLAAPHCEPNAKELIESKVLLTIKEVLVILRMKRSAFDVVKKQANFPKPAIDKRSPLYRTDEIVAWINDPTKGHLITK